MGGGGVIGGSPLYETKHIRYILLWYMMIEGPQRVIEFGPMISMLQTTICELHGLVSMLFGDSNIPVPKDPRMCIPSV